MIKRHGRKKDVILIDTMMDIHRLKDRLKFSDANIMKLEAENRSLRDRLMKLQPQLQSWLNELPKLRSENNAFRHALEIYANEDNWEDTSVWVGEGDTYDLFGWEIAKDVLRLDSVNIPKYEESL